MEISFDYLHSLGEGHKIAVYEAEAGDKIRFIAPYLDKYFIIFWLQTLDDGSVYCGIRKPGATKYKTGTISPIGKNLTLNFEDGQPMSDMQYKNTRMSFHGSGEIHTLEYGKITMRKPLQELTSQEELFVVIFEDISKFDTITTTRKKDVCILW